MTPMQKAARAICRAEIIAEHAPKAFEAARVDEMVEANWRHYTPHATAALSALEAEGWKLMPREATEEMIKSGRMVGDVSYSEVYAAMYAAAPKPE